MKTGPFTIFLIFVISICTFSQQPAPTVNIAPNASKDKPIDVKNDERRQYEDAIKPYIAMAKKTYPQAKGDFLKGLPPKQSFFITTRLHDASGKIEQVFIAVREIKNGFVKGTIASDIQLVAGFKFGDGYSFPEGDLMDWTITKPDGSEDGNFVGKFLDTYRPKHIVDAPSWRDQPATPEGITQRIEAIAVKYQANAPIPRVAFYDIGYPRDEKEYAALGGNAVIMITALTQDREELPIKRVYVISDGKQIELRQIKLVLSEQTENKDISSKVFGSFRADALYVLPIKLRMSPGDLMSDFAKNTTGFKLAVFGSPVSEDVDRVVKKAVKVTGMTEAALDAFIKREFPSFFW